MRLICEDKLKPEPRQWPPLEYSLPDIETLERLSQVEPDRPPESGLRFVAEDDAED